MARSGIPDVQLKELLDVIENWDGGQRRALAQLILMAAEETGLRPGVAYFLRLAAERVMTFPKGH